MRLVASANFGFSLVLGILFPRFLYAEPFVMGQEYLPPKAFSISQPDMSGCVYSSRADKNSLPSQFLFPSGKKGECIDPSLLDYSTEKIKVKREDNSVIDAKKSRLVFHDDSSKVTTTVEAEPMTDRDLGDPKITIGNREYNSGFMPSRVRVILKSEDGTEKKVEFCQRIIKTGKFPKYEHDYLLSKAPPEQDRCYNLVEANDPKNRIDLNPVDKKVSSLDTVPHARPNGLPLNDHDSYATATQPNGRPVVEELPAL